MRTRSSPARSPGRGRAQCSRDGGCHLRALLAICLLAGTVARAEPRSWEDPIRARAEELAARASQRFDEVMSARRIVEIKETAVSPPIAVAIGRVMIIGAGDSVSGMLLAD